MVVAPSDFRVNSMVRSILSRHWIDLRALKFGSFRGTVRLVGELHPARAPELCLAAATGRSQSASGPEYVRRDLLLRRCDPADSALIRWRLPGGRLGPAAQSAP